MKMGKKSSLCEVVDVNPCEVSLKPMLIEFEHGLLKKEEVGKLKWDFMKNADNPKEYMLLVNSNEDEYQYKSHKVDEESQLCQRFFVIRNKRTNKIRLASVDQIVVSRYLDNVIDSVDESHNVSQAADRLEFLEAFGSKAARKKVLSSTANKVKSDEYHSRLEESVKLSKTNELELSTTVSENSGNLVIPVANENATCVNEIFTLESLFGTSDLLDSINELAVTMIENIPTTPSKDISQFLVDTIKKVKSTTKELSVDSVKCLLYVDALVKFAQIEARKLNNKLTFYSVCPLSKHIRQRVLLEFTVKTPSGRTRPLRMKDKALSHILVLLMIAFKYRLDIDFVATELKPAGSLAKFTQIARAIGFSKVYSQKVWVLQYPLKRSTTGAPRKKGR